MFKKWVLILAAVIEVILVVVFFAAGAKIQSYHLGFVIDKTFLENLAACEFYMTLRDGVSAFALFFLAAILFYCWGLRKSIKEGENRDKGPLWGTVIFIVTAFVFAVPELSELPTRSTERVYVQTERLKDKDVVHHKSGSSYYLIFSGGKDLRVTSKRYDYSRIGNVYYTFYQGDILIQALLADQYLLKDLGDSYRD